MPTFQQVIDSNPAKFSDAGGDLDSAGSDIGDLRSEYGRQVKTLGNSWNGDDYDALGRDKDTLVININATKLKVEAAGKALQLNGPIMKVLSETLEQTKKGAETAQFKVLPAPFCIPSQQQLQQASSLGPGAPAAYAALIATSTAISTALIAQYTAVCVQDATAAAALHTLGLSLRDVSGVIGQGISIGTVSRTVRQDPGQRPNKFRATTVKDAEKRSTNPQGEVEDWHSQQRIDMTQRRTWDMGHPYGYESRKHEEVARLWESKIRQQGLNPRTEVLRQHNDVPYRIETTNTNRTHVGEAPDEINYWVQKYRAAYGDPLDPVI
ncbi:hypothetical protein [Glycomyces rhizosphaerae]|uniref:Uncharacterized protein n=1 Tax=Glycomyces rhizosphaerae TaxID=2054422 RepID=A0ABV7PZ12_9ACTN